MSMKYQIIIPGSLATIAIFSGAILASNNIYADDVVDEVNITVPVSCLLSGAGMNTHNAEITNGTVNSAIGETTLKAFCNDNNGFAIYAIGYTDNTDGKNVLTSSALGSTYDIATGTATSGDTSNWAMKLSTVTDPAPTYPIIIAGSSADINKEQGDPDYSTFQAVPDDYALVAKRTSNTDIGASAEGSTIKSTYQAYISKTQPAGTYTGQVKYTLVHPSSHTTPSITSCEPGKICYNANAGDVLGAMEPQSLEKEKDWSSCNTYTDNQSICVVDGQPIDISTLPELNTYTAPTLQAYNFKREGHGFAGWNDKSDGTGTNYGPSQTITTTGVIDEVVTQGLNLYANWIPSAGSLQGWTGCSAMTAGSITALTDTRDNNTYAVAKLADGNCWMIENLRLADRDSNNNLITLSSTNTNNPASTFTSLSATSDTWCTDNNEACINQNKLNTNNTNIGGTNVAGTTLVPSPNANVSDSAQWYGYGNYYNWYTTTAGTGTYSVSGGNNATGDICPNGWSTPTGGNIGAQFDTLDIAIRGTNNDRDTAEASNRWRSYPNNFLYSGIWQSSVAVGHGSHGIYWSRSSGGSDYAGVLDFTPSYVRPVVYDMYKNGGHTVRCLTSGT